MSGNLVNSLEAGIGALALALPDGAAARLIDYIGLLNHWNRAFNLTAIRDPEEMVSKHLLDSLAVLPYLGEGDVIDVGTGAGLPGIPLALARREQRFTLVDTNGKKTRFIEQAKIVLGIDNIDVVNSRVETYRPDRPFDIVIARAYAHLNEFIATTKHLHGSNTRVLVMQGRLDENLTVDGYVIEESIELAVPGLAASRHLLVIGRQ